MIRLVLLGHMVHLGFSAQFPATGKHHGLPNFPGPQIHMSPLGSGLHRYFPPCLLEIPRAQYIRNVVCEGFCCTHHGPTIPFNRNNGFTTTLLAILVNLVLPRCYLLCLGPISPTLFCRVAVLHNAHGPCPGQNVKFFLGAWRPLANWRKHGCENRCRDKAGIRTPSVRACFVMSDD